MNEKPVQRLHFVPEATRHTPKATSFPPATSETPVLVTPGRCALMSCRIIPLQNFLGWKIELLLCCHKPIYSGSAATQPEAVTRWKKHSIGITSHHNNPSHSTAELTHHWRGDACKQNPQSNATTQMSSWQESLRDLCAWGNCMNLALFSSTFLRLELWAGCSGRFNWGVLVLCHLMLS